MIYSPGAALYYLLLNTTSSPHQIKGYWDWNKPVPISHCSSLSVHRTHHYNMIKQLLELLGAPQLEVYSPASR